MAAYTSQRCGTEETNRYLKNLPKLFSGRAGPHPVPYRVLLGPSMTLVGHNPPLSWWVYQQGLS